MPASAAGGGAALVNCVTSGTGRVVCSSLGGGVIAFLVVLALVYIGIFAVVILAYVKILAKAGYSAWWLLIGLVPVAGFVMFLVFAFSEWPVLRELKMLRAQHGYAGGFGAPAGYGTGPGPWGGGPGAAVQSGRPYGPPGAGGVGAAGSPPQGPVQAGTAPTDQGLPPFRNAGPVDAGGGAVGDVPSSTAVVAPAEGGVPDPGRGQPAHLPGPTQPASAPAGWYPVPDGRRRYWDGAAWTDHFA